MPANGRADDLMGCRHVTAPQDGHRRLARGCGREGDLLDDRAQEPLAISHRGRFGFPDGGHIQGELADCFLLLVVSRASGSVFWATAYSRSRLGQRLQGRIPAFFQFACDQSILRIDGIILALGQPHRIACPFKPELPALFTRAGVPAPRSPGPRATSPAGRVAPPQRSTARTASSR